MGDGVDPDFRDNETAHRFELPVDGHVAYIDYERVPAGVAMLHTIVPEALGGRGVGGRLVRSALVTARERGWKVRPDCPFVAAFIKKNPEFADLVLEA